MGKLTRGHITETTLWLVFAAILYFYSFEFEQNIEIYRFGASAWPRALIALMVLAALGNLYFHWINGDDNLQKTGAIIDPDDLADNKKSGAGGDSKTGVFGRVGAMLAMPMVYAYFMESIGFFSLTPFFIAAVMILMGERRPLWIIAMTVVTYAIILIIFAGLLNTNLPVGTMHPFYDYSNWLLVILQGRWGF